MFVSLWLNIFLWLGVCSWKTSGFQPVRLVPKKRHRIEFLGSLRLRSSDDIRKTTTWLQSSPQDEENFTTNDKQEPGVTDGKPSLVSESNDPTRRALVAQGALNVVTSLWSAFIFTFGAIFTSGMVLNLFGYGYTVFPPRIEPLEEFRMERQLMEPSASNSIFATAGGGDETFANQLRVFFLRNPFTTTIVLLGIVLAYEALLGYIQKFSSTNQDRDNK